MKNKYIFLNIILFIIAALIVTRLVSIQLVHGEEYKEQSEKRLLRTVSIEAPRGEIYDRYGRPIVTNRMGFTVQIQRLRKQTGEEINEIVNRLHNIFALYGVDIKYSLPIIYDGSDFAFSFEETIDEPLKKEKAWKKAQNYDENMTANDVVNELIEKYGVNEDNYSKMQILKILDTRFEMTKCLFSVNTPFNFADDVDMEIITAIKEQNNYFTGVDVITRPVRKYTNPTSAVHILGRIGKIGEEEYAQFKDTGYTIDSMIGKQGIEKYLENTLKGIDGKSSVEQTIDGRSVNVVSQTDAVSGKNVTLTIDYDLQQKAEKCLEETIYNIRNNAATAAEGKEADSGALTVIDVNSGEILAMASYPTYDVEKFNSTYSLLSSDPSNPLYNRAVAGTYAPGSTLKMLVAIAALEEGIITPEDEIFDRGVYNYYKGYTPMCWVYRQRQTTHGYENVTEAIRDSCNYFFYEVGRLLTIEKINKYQEMFGLGLLNGIELPGEEKKGTVAGPAERQENGGIWYPGDTLQAAIGQSDNLFTPLQLANYVATIANGGIRYKPHLVKTIQDSNGVVEKEYLPEILNKIDISQSTYDAVRSGMRKVVTEGTAMTAFSDCSVSVAAKTGSAQIGNNYTNGIFVAYAPYDKPQIAIAAVIEKAGGGGAVSPLVRGIIESYFSSEKETDEIQQTNTLIRD